MPRGFSLYGVNYFYASAQPHFDDFTRKALIFTRKAKIITSKIGSNFSNFASKITRNLNSFTRNIKCIEMLLVFMSRVASLTLRVT